MAALLATSACVTMPSERAEAPPLPSHWRDAPPARTLPVTDWWQGFNDPALNAAGRRSADRRPDACSSPCRASAKRARFRYSTITQYLPELMATGSGQYTRVVEGAGRARRRARADDGRLRRASVVGIAAVRASAPLRPARAPTRKRAVADLRGAQVALAADVAQAYVDLRAAQASYVALTRSVANRRRTRAHSRNQRRRRLRVGSGRRRCAASG